MNDPVVLCNLIYKHLVISSSAPMPDLPFLRPLFLLGSPKGIVLGKLSGRNALNTRLKAMGYDVSSTELDDVFK